MSPCDCLNNCGDDPRVRDGRAEPGAQMLARRKDWAARATADKVIALIDAGKLQAARAGILELGEWSERGRRMCGQGND